MKLVNSLKVGVHSKAPKVRVFSTGGTVAIATCTVTKRTMTLLQIIEHLFDSMTIASSVNELL